MQQNRLASLYILTDGQPNVEPPRGHIPMLKQWLDQNLPDLVERIVAREVARITGR